MSEASIDCLWGKQSFCGYNGAGLHVCSGQTPSPESVYHVRQVRLVRYARKTGGDARRRHICTPIDHDLPSGCRWVQVDAGGMFHCRSPCGALRSCPPFACGLPQFGTLTTYHHETWCHLGSPARTFLCREPPIEARSHPRTKPASQPANRQISFCPRECHQHHRTNCFHRMRSRPSQRSASLNAACCPQLLHLPGRCRARSPCGSCCWQLCSCSCLQSPMPSFMSRSPSTTQMSAGGA